MKDIEYGQDCAFAFSHYTKIEQIFPDILNWRIKDMKYEERVEKTKNSKMYSSIFENTKVNEFIKNQHINEGEILSWIDSMYLLKRLFEHPDLNSKIKDARIIQEYVIPYTKDNRADAIICKDNKLVIIEFTYEKSKYITDKDILIIDDTIGGGQTIKSACQVMMESYAPKSITVLTLLSRLH